MRPRAPVRLTRIALVAALSSVPVVAACSLALDYSGIDDGVPDAAGLPPDDGRASGDAPAPGPDAATDAPLARDAPLAADAPIESDCPVLEGPPLVRVGTFCIDSTEVTVDEYTRFLADKAGDTSGQPAECRPWNASFIPQGWPQSPGNVPVVGVNWCMGTMYCAWAGKRLCGDADGGAAEVGAWGNAARSQWFKACSRNGDGLHAYPYGNAYDAAACNGVDRDARAPVPSLASCVGGYPGLFDMSGNVAEWEDSCTVSDGGDHSGDFCHTRGGAFDRDKGGLQCDDGLLYSRASPPGNVGIRCCTR